MAAPAKGGICERRKFEAGPWQISSCKGHILTSSCEEGLKGGCPAEGERCALCRYTSTLELSCLPEMVFGDNYLRLELVGGAGVEFNALDALRCVKNEAPSDLKVATAEAWQKTRTAQDDVTECPSKFDWTYTTDYKGTIIGEGIKVECTDERIDLDRLRERERIHFYEEMVLFEDELADNGTASLTLKMRVMASGFLVLMRFFLRVDGVLVRINDTRLYLQAGSNYMLREYCSKEEKIPNLKMATTALVDPNALAELLPIKELIVHKLTLPI